MDSLNARFSGLNIENPFQSIPEVRLTPFTPGECIDALREGTQRVVDVKKRLRQIDIDEQWMEEFVTEGGLELIWTTFESCAEYLERTKTTAMLNCIECTKAACAKESAMNRLISSHFATCLVNGMDAYIQLTFMHTNVHAFSRIAW